MFLQGLEQVPVPGAQVAVRQGAQAFQLVVPQLRGGALQGHEGHLQGHAGVGGDAAVPVGSLLQGKMDERGTALPGLAEAGALVLQELHGPVHGAHGDAAQLSGQARLGDAALAGIADGFQYLLQPRGLDQVAAVGAGGLEGFPGRGTGHGDLLAQGLVSDCPKARAQSPPLEPQKPWMRPSSRERPAEGGSSTTWAPA